MTPRSAAALALALLAGRALAGDPLVEPMPFDPAAPITLGIGKPNGEKLARRAQAELGPYLTRAMKRPVKVEILPDYDARALHRLLPERQPGQLLWSEVASHDGQVPEDRLVARRLGRAQGPGVEPLRRTVEVDAAGLVAEVEGDGAGAVDLLEGGGEKVLPVVLLHVMQATRPAGAGPPSTCSTSPSASCTSRTGTPAMVPRSAGCPPPSG
jgi:hypothetical protein